MELPADQAEKNPAAVIKDRITCTIRDSAEVSSLSIPTINRLIAAEKLATVKIGRRRLVRVDSLLRLLGDAA